MIIQSMCNKETRNERRVPRPRGAALPGARMPRLEFHLGVAVGVVWERVLVGACGSSAAVTAGPTFAEGSRTLRGARTGCFHGQGAVENAHGPGSAG